MDVDAHSYDWAGDTYAALNAHSLDAPSDKWMANDHSFSIPPSMLSHGSIERYGQVTPPEDLSPASPRRDSVRETSIPLEQLRNEALFPEHQLEALRDYHPRLEAQQQLRQEPSSPLQPPHEGPSSKRRRTSRAPANQAQPTADPAPPQQESAAPQPPKRKRGRPKSQPQMVETLTADGFPFQVSSARQSHLEKNRVAAHKCRMRKKDYINGLEERARVFTTKNKALKENVAMLREEVLELKNEVLRHAGCGFWAVDEYLARCAGDLLGMKPPAAASPSTQLQQTPTMASMELSSAASVPSSGMSESPDHDDYGTFDMLEDMDEKFDV